MYSSFDVVLSGNGLFTFGFINTNEAQSAINVLTFGFVGEDEVTWSDSEESVTTTWSNSEEAVSTTWGYN